MYIFMSQYLIKDPVEYIEEEEGQREAGPRHSVNLLGSVDKQLPHLVSAFTPSTCRRSRWILGSVRRGSGVVQYSNSVVGAGLRLLAVARGGGDGSCGGQSALMYFPFLLEEQGRGGGRVTDNSVY